jgi:photosystem II stability/assembly factor-like uncharacterized protein
MQFLKNASWLLPISGVTALVAAIFLISQADSETESMQEIMEPYDQFAFQRSYPDRDFDWKGWRAAMQAARRGTVEARSTGCGGGTPTNWTLQGPSNVGGRVNTIAVKPNDDATVLAGFSGGGMFKSSDGGVNWHPVFDENTDLAIGHIIFDPLNPNVVYAGTGDPNIPSIAFNGNGIYKSADAGETWQYLGLGMEGIVSKIQINPLNTQVLYAATMGNPSIRDTHRGVYKSSDGGQTWQEVLFVSNQAGASDLVINPANPQILYAAFWDRIRNNQESIIYGTHAKIYKTTDGGANWTPLAGGLPAGIQGRIGLALSQQNPDKVYAVYVDTLSNPGGIYKTIDGGATWQLQSISGLQSAYGGFGWYFAQLRLNPANDEDLYFLGVLLWRKMPGGSWQPGAGGHADSHDFVITSSGKRYWASDGGVYRSPSGQSNFTKCNNLPTTQIYHTDYNPHQPNTYFIGAQDNGIQNGIGKPAINNWITLFFADGFNTVFDPVDSSTFWIEIQNGTIYKTTDGGNSWGQAQNTLGTTDRTNWNTPFFMSPHHPPKRFAATYRVYESNADNWTPLSGDLTSDTGNQDLYHSVSALDESPVLAEKLIAGTSDGNIWRREPTGPWVKISTGLQNRYVSSVHGSPTSSDRIFVTYSGFSANYVAHVLKSDNNGQTWTDISGNLPSLPVNDLYVFPNQSDLVMCAASDAGVYLTTDGGQNWSRLGGNMPYIPVFALERNPVKNQLLAATFGRGLYTFPLDSLLSQPSGAVVNLSGNIKTEIGAGVSATRVNTQPLFSTDTAGLYSIMGLPGCQSYTITPYRNDNPLNGVTTYDLVLISKHILGVAPLGSPYKLIAADVNRSGSVTTFDIVLLRKLILGIDTAFSNTQSWRYVASDFVFPNPMQPFLTAFPESRTVQVQTAPLSGLNFIGMKTGDVNGSAQPFGAVAQDRTDGTWPMTLTDQDFGQGDGGETVLSIDASGLAGMQFSLQFDPSQLELDHIEPLAVGITADHFGINRASSGHISCCFEANPRQPWEGTTSLFRLVFRARAAGRVSGAIQVSEMPTPALAYDVYGQVRKPEIRSLSADTPTGLVWPNPSGGAGLWMQCPVKGEEICRLTVYDQKGNLVIEREVGAWEARNGFELPGGLFPAAGVYYFRLDRAGEKGWIGKMVRI